MPRKQPARDPALERLDAFLGEWTMEATFPAAPPSRIIGRTAFEWTLDRQFLLQRSEVPHPDAPNVHAVIAVDFKSQAYCQHYFDSRGVARVYAMDFTGGVWTLLRDSPDFTPLDFSQRFTGTFSDDGQTIHGEWETSREGSRWEHDFDLTYTKLN
jgi:hypothetical protein